LKNNYNVDFQTLTIIYYEFILPIALKDT